MADAALGAQARPAPGAAYAEDVERLVKAVRAYDQDADGDRIRRAFSYAAEKHSGQKRYSGEPYISHPLAVAGVLADLRMDEASVITALLHDTVEDTDATLEEVGRLFGPDVALMTDGVTKLAKIRFLSQQNEQAENFRKLLVAMASDVRVLLVKLADRLHNMRTLGHHPKPEKRRRIAEETLEIFAPLAGRIGMQAMREELEQLSFVEINPEASEAVEKRIASLEADAGDRVPQILRALESELRAAGIGADVSGRRKTVFSIWRKMQEKDIAFEQLSDIFGFRIIVESVEECYAALGAVHRKWRCVPGRFKDYISTPKRNGYQSIHTTVIGPSRQRVEIQIRTRDMHDVAERGVAAHWRYKDDASSTSSSAFVWLRDLAELLEENQDAEELFEHSKLELFLDQVFCFTPKGDLIALPRGACCIDFAFAVHTEVGAHCVGAKVNGRVMPLRTILNNGDTVEILTSSAQGPEAVWESWVTTGRARAFIRKFRRNKEREDHIRLGRQIVRAAFQQAALPETDKALEAAASRIGGEDGDTLLERVGRGEIGGQEVVRAAFPEADKSVLRRLARGFRLRSGSRERKAAPIAIEGLTQGLAVHLAPCCSPLPGDRIVGIMRPGVGAEVHTIDCGRLADFDESPDSWLDLSWRADAGEVMNPVGRVRINLEHDPGSMADVTALIARYGCNITHIRISERRPDYFSLTLDIEVEDARHLTAVIAALRASPKVLNAERQRR